METEKNNNNKRINGAAKSKRALQIQRRYSVWLDLSKHSTPQTKVIVQFVLVFRVIFDFQNPFTVCNHTIQTDTDTNSSDFGWMCIVRFAIQIFRCSFVLSLHTVTCQKKRCSSRRTVYSLSNAFLLLCSRFVFSALRCCFFFSTLRFTLLSFHSFESLFMCFPCFPCACASISHVLVWIINSL